MFIKFMVICYVTIKTNTPILGNGILLLLPSFLLARASCRIHRLKGGVRSLKGVPKNLWTYFKPLQTHREGKWGHVDTPNVQR